MGDFVCSKCGLLMLAICRQADHIVVHLFVYLLLLDLLGSHRTAYRRVRPSLSLRPVVQGQGGEKCVKPNCTRARVSLDEYAGACVERGGNEGNA
ncbi:unnamed protein product [Prunus armeniaca]